MTNLNPVLSIVITYYNNPKMMDKQIANICSMPIHVLRNIELIIVDDGSRVSPLSLSETTTEQKVGLSITGFRITKDKPWNQHAARNIGVKHALAEFVLLTDVDHLLNEDLLGHLVNKINAQALDKHACFFLRRQNTSGQKLKSHVNSFVVSQKCYWSVRGYDERLTGMYGTDLFFRRDLRKKCNFKLLANYPLILHDLVTVEDANTRNIKRARKALLSRLKSRLYKEYIYWFVSSRFNGGKKLLQCDYKVIFRVLL